MPAKVKLELVGLNGNAFNLQAHFRQAARHQWLTAEAIQAVIDEAANADTITSWQLS